MNLYLIRHGQSETNLNGVFTGQADVSLTEQGERDARRAGELLRGISFDRVYASDLRRAIRTAELALPGAEIETDPLLREYDLGALVGKTPTVCLEEYGPSFSENWKRGDYTPYGGENTERIRERAREFLAELAESEHGRVAVFAHAGWIRAAFDVLLGAQGKSGSVAVANGSISVVRINQSKKELLLWNYTGRLPDGGTADKPI